MSAEIPYFEPKTFAKGEKLHWKRAFSDYSAEDYTLQYRFRGQTGAGHNQTATADGSEFVIQVTAAVTATFTAEKYVWQAWLTEIADSTNTFMLESGESQVTAGFTPDSTAAVDLRSTAQKLLDAIDAMIEGKAEADVQEYTIQGRQLKKIPLSDLVELRKYYANIVAREKLDARRKSGKGLFKTSYVQVNEV